MTRVAGALSGRTLGIMGSLAGALVVVIGVGSVVRQPGDVIPEHPPESIAERARVNLRLLAAGVGMKTENPHFESCLDLERKGGTCERALRVSVGGEERATLWWAQGLRMHGAKRFADGALACHRARELAPRVSEFEECLALNLQEVCLAAERMEELDQCEAALALTEDRARQAELHFRIGTIYGASSQHSLEEALEFHDPGGTEYGYGRVEWHFERSQYHCAQAVSLDPAQTMYQGCVALANKGLALAQEALALIRAPAECGSCLSINGCADWLEGPSRRLLGWGHAQAKYHECGATVLRCSRHGITCKSICGVLRKPECGDVL